MNQTADILLCIILGMGLCIAVLSDLRFKRIPNLLTYPLMAAALAVHFITHGLGGLAFGAEGLGLGIALFLLPYLMGGMGAGDAKLMGAAGAVLGPKGVFIAALFTAAIGGVYAMVLLVLDRRYSRGMITRSATTLKTFAFTGQSMPIPPQEKEERPKLCYGIAIATGTFLYLLLTWSGLLWIH
ncbi:MAG: prepilin peptidase [Syntrophobacterales bacterium]